MHFAQLAVVKQRAEIGVPLPFNVRDADQTLLLARGQVVATRSQMEALLARGALVDLAELRVGARQVAAAAPRELPGLWRECMEGVARALKASPQPGYSAALADAAEPVLALIDRDPDLAIFQVLRHEANTEVQYGVTHSVHTAITAHLVAQRLGWDARAAETAFKAALTMNISMLELQGQLAQQADPVRQDQHDLIHSHPLRSVEMLELAGITERDWLDAVAQHHEMPGGLGYPAALHEVTEAALLVQRADTYTAKLSPRLRRNALAADQAGRQMFMQDPGHPMTVALAKEFGLYPPGCHVWLANGELGIVVKRGDTVRTPLVAALVSERGAAFADPRRRDTALREFAVAGVVAESKVTVRVAAEALVELAEA